MQLIQGVYLYFATLPSFPGLNLWGRVFLEFVFYFLEKIAQCISGPSDFQEFLLLIMFPSFVQSLPVQIDCALQFWSDSELR